MKNEIFLFELTIKNNWFRLILLMFLCSWGNTTFSQSTYSFPTNNLVYKKLTEKNEDQGIIFFQSNTSINSTKSDFLSSLEGSQKLSVLFRLLDQIERTSIKNMLFKKSGIDFNLGINALYLRPIDISEDSLDLNSLIFPDAANSGVQICPVWHYWFSSRINSRIVHRLSFESSFSLRQVIVKNLINPNTNADTRLNFSVLNYNISPIRYSFFYTTTKDLKFVLTISPYFNYFNIPNEDVTMFNLLFPNNDPLFKTDQNSFMRSIGIKVIGTINGFSMFADIRENMNTSNLMDSNPYKGFVFNVGFSQNFVTNF